MIIIVILSLIPIVIWSLMLPLSIRFYDLTSITTSIGQILGLVGIVLFSINLILAGRLKILDKYFKGLDKVYAYHSQIGTISFSMILFHPVFLVIRFLTISTQEAIMFFVPFISPSVTLGIFSLALMMVLISITFYIKMKYNYWKLSHKFMTVAFALGVMHVFLISSDISRNNVLRIYILTLALTGLFFSVRRAFLSKALISKSIYKIEKVRLLNENITEIEMSLVKEKITFNAGQFIFVSFKYDGLGESHPFSISSGEDEENLKLVVKDLGDYTRRLKGLPIGVKVEIEGPFGGFSYKNSKNKDQIWVAGGIGITPFLSMAKTLNEDYKINFYYCVRNRNEAALIDDLIKIADKNINFKVNLWCSGEENKGFINAEMISNSCGGITDKDIFLCGPKVFMESLNEQFISQGVEKNKIYYENFNFI